MSRGPTSFKQRDVMRLLKAARAAGVEVSRVEVDKSGKIALITAKTGAPDTVDAQGGNPWDAAL
jgi:hypothetical protein